jgi:4-amino-4-deoxy-L-arabinose transferase-like glycosyltransferase
LPLALAHPLLSWRELGARRRGILLAAAWAAGILFFFSLAVSRLEHYALPALPAVALLLAAFLGAPLSPRWRTATAVALVMTAAAALAGVFIAPAALSSIEWLRELPELRNIARFFFAGIAATFAAAVAAGRRRPVLSAPLVAAGMLLLMPLAYRGLATVGRFNSSAPVAAALLRQADIDRARVVFAAPTEYQNVAGLCFYLRRRVDLLAPAGFVAPDYLAPHVAALFLDRDELAALWARGPAYFVTDPLDPQRPVEDLVPAPRQLVAEVANRSILGNRATDRRAP